MRREAGLKTLSPSKALSTFLTPTNPSSSSSGLSSSVPALPTTMAAPSMLKPPEPEVGDLEGYGPADTSAIVRMKTQRGTSNPFPTQAASPTKDEIKRSYEKVSDQNEELRKTLLEVAEKSKKMDCWRA